MCSHFSKPDKYFLSGFLLLKNLLVANQQKVLGSAEGIPMEESMCSHFFKPDKEYLSGFLFLKIC